MKRHLRLSLEVVGLGVIAFLLWHSSRPHDVDRESPLAVRTVSMLDEAGEEAKAAILVVSSRVVTAVRQEKGEPPVVRSQYVPPEASIKIVTKKTGEVKIHVKSRGFCFSPNVGLAHNGRLSGWVGFKWAYVGKFGLESGLVVESQMRFPRLAMGASYQPPGPFKNTAVAIVIDNRKTLWGVVRVKL